MQPRFCHFEVFADGSRQAGTATFCLKKRQEGGDQVVGGLLEACLTQCLYSIVQNNEHMFKIMNIFTTPALEALIFLGRNYRNSYYVRELATHLSISTGSASSQLRALREAGLLTSEQKGRTLLFRANISHPLVREVKIFASLLELSPVISERSNIIVRMILFGSCATGEDTADSDIDLYIETTDREKANALLSRVGSALSRKLSPIVVTTEESAQLRARDRPLFERIRSGRVLAGEML